MKWKVCLAALLAAASAAAQFVSPPPAPLGKPKLVRGSLWAIEAPMNGAEGPNVAFYVTSEGVVVIDDRFDQDYALAAERVKSVTGQPIRYVIKTHNHGANTGEYRKLLPQVEGITGAKSRANMVRMQMAAPPRVVYEREMSLWLGGKEIRLLQLGASHTNGDTVVYFPAERAVYVGDLMAATDRVTNPSVDYRSGGSLLEWPAVLDKVLALEIDSVIPGTGYPVTDRAALLAHRTKVAKVGERTKVWVRAGKTKAEIEAALIAEFGFKPVNMHGLDGMIAESK